MKTLDAQINELVRINEKIADLISHRTIVRNAIARRLRHKYKGDGFTATPYKVTETKVRAHTRGGYNTFRITT